MDGSLYRFFEQNHIGYALSLILVVAGVKLRARWEDRFCFYLLGVSWLFVVWTGMNTFKDWRTGAIIGCIAAAIILGLCKWFWPRPSVVPPTTNVHHSALPRSYVGEIYTDVNSDGKHRRFEVVKQDTDKVYTKVTYPGDSTISPDYSETQEWWGEDWVPFTAKASIIPPAPSTQTSAVAGETKAAKGITELSAVTRDSKSVPKNNERSTPLVVPTDALDRAIVPIQSAVISDVAVGQIPQFTFAIQNTGKRTTMGLQIYVVRGLSGPDLMLQGHVTITSTITATPPPPAYGDFGQAVPVMGAADVLPGSPPVRGKVPFPRALSSDEFGDLKTGRRVLVFELGVFYGDMTTATTTEHPVNDRGPWFTKQAYRWVPQTGETVFAIVQPFWNWTK